MKLSEITEAWTMQSQRPFSVAWEDPQGNEKHQQFYNYEDAHERLQKIKNSINPFHKKEAEAIRWTLKKIDSVEDAE